MIDSERGFSSPTSNVDQRLAAATIGSECCLREALEALDRGAMNITLVVDTAGRLLGTITDGDARRAILRGIDLTAPVTEVMNRQFVAAGMSTGRAEILDLMRARTIEQLPILDTDKRLVGVHLLRETISVVPRKNAAVLMAGGRGERLRPLTDSIPKPMIGVAGRPILERIVLHLVGHGIRHVYISVHYKAEVIERHFGDGSGYGCRIEYLRESEPLGTGGALSLLPKRPLEPLLVVNGDLLTQFDVGNMLAYHARQGAVATVGVHEYRHRVPFGVVELDGDRICETCEKPTHRWLANAGIYVLEAHLVDRVPKGTAYALTALVDDCLSKGERVTAYHLQDEWMDLGQADELKRARGGRE